MSPRRQDYHCRSTTRGSRAFMSTTMIYQPAGHTACRESVSPSSTERNAPASPQFYIHSNPPGRRATDKLDRTDTGRQATDLQPRDQLWAHLPTPLLSGLSGFPCKLRLLTTSPALAPSSYEHEPSSIHMQYVCACGQPGKEDLRTPHIQVIHHTAFLVSPDAAITAMFHAVVQRRCRGETSHHIVSNVRRRNTPKLLLAYQGSTPRAILTAFTRRHG